MWTKGTSTTTTGISIFLSISIGTCPHTPNLQIDTTGGTYRAGGTTCSVPSHCHYTAQCFRAQQEMTSQSVSSFILNNRWGEERCNHQLACPLSLLLSSKALFTQPAWRHERQAYQEHGTCSTIRSTCVPPTTCLTTLRCRLRGPR